MDKKVIGKLSQFLDLYFFVSKHACRSSTSADDTVFVEKTYMDLELSYGRTESGKSQPQQID